jgi:hypothetical protein
MSGFTLDWLKLRDSADLAARHAGLARAFAAALPRRGERPVRLIDLGAGSGANIRALLPRIAGDQHWIAIDRDRDLLAAQADACTAWARRQGYPITAGGGRIAIAARSARWQIEAMPLDLGRDLASLAELGADGVTAAAFFDLVSREWLARFVALVTRQRAPLLAVLTVDGRREWLPRLTEDALVAEAFARHQHRDKGFGPALGPEVPDSLAELLTAAGYRIERAASDWRLDARSEALLTALIAGEAGAAAEAAPDDAERIAAWERQRRAQLADDLLHLTIGHCDLLALPA